MSAPAQPGDSTGYAWSCGNDEIAVGMCAGYPAFSAPATSRPGLSDRVRLRHAAFAHFDGVDGTVGDLPVGTKVFVDGPHGVFSPDLYEGPSFCLIAGGVGIRPTMSILRTFADRDDRRPILAMVASNNWDDITFREELDEIAHRENVTIVHTLSNPPDDWQGESGRIDSAMLRRYLPTGSHRWQYFICGPDPMMDAMEHALLELDVPDGRIRTERFGWV